MCICFQYHSEVPRDGLSSLKRRLRRQLVHSAAKHLQKAVGYSCNFPLPKRAVYGVVVLGMACEQRGTSGSMSQAAQPTQIIYSQLKPISYVGENDYSSSNLAAYLCQPAPRNLGAA